MRCITPAQFYASFYTVLTEHQAELASRWDKTRDYTQFMLGTVLPDVGKHIDLTCYYRDYYTLDCIYYEDCDREHLPHGTYAKYIAVAVEHENDLRGSCEEMNKLQLFNTPLRVLITYAAPNAAREWLGKYTKIIQNADIFNDTATLRRQLVVFGHKPESFPVWNGYVFEQGGFAEIAHAGPSEVPTR